MKRKEIDNQCWTKMIIVCWDSDYDLFILIYECSNIEICDTLFCDVDNIYRYRIFKFLVKPIMCSYLSPVHTIKLHHNYLQIPIKVTILINWRQVSDKLSLRVVAG